MSFPITACQLVHEVLTSEFLFDLLSDGHGSLVQLLWLELLTWWNDTDIPLNSNQNINEKLRTIEIREF